MFHTWAYIFVDRNTSIWAFLAIIVDTIVTMRGFCCWVVPVGPKENKWLCFGFCVWQWRKFSLAYLFWRGNTRRKNDGKYPETKHRWYDLAFLQGGWIFVLDLASGLRKPGWNFSHVIISYNVYFVKIFLKIHFGC